jgi:hypothetical protein
MLKNHYLILAKNLIKVNTDSAVYTAVLKRVGCGAARRRVLLTENKGILSNPAAEVTFLFIVTS